MLTQFRKIAFALVAAAALTACETASDAAIVPLRDLLYRVPAREAILVTENNGVLPRRTDREFTGVGFTQVDLATNHSVMVGFNEAYIAGYDLMDGEATDRGYAEGAGRTNYEIFRAPGTGGYDYALVYNYRNDGTWLENICYYAHASVYRLRPGVINFIPASIQPPRYDGSRVDVSQVATDTTELRRVLSRFPIGTMEVVVPEVVAVVQFAPDRMDRALSGNRCSFINDFTILQRHDQ